MCGLDPVWSRCFVSLWKRTLHWEFGIAFSCLCGLLLSPWRNCSKISVVRGYYKAKFNWFPTRAKEHTMVNINSATLTLDNSSHRSPSHAMVKYNWVLSWVFCPSPSSFLEPSFQLGDHTFVRLCLCRSRCRRCSGYLRCWTVQAGGADREISWLAVVDRSACGSRHRHLIDHTHSCWSVHIGTDYRHEHGCHLSPGCLVGVADFAEMQKRKILVCLTRTYAGHCNVGWEGYPKLK